MMIQNVKEYVEPYITLGLPVPYKSLSLYPFYMKDVYDLYFTIDILMIEKNKIPDVRIIQMNYLQFLWYECLNNMENIQNQDCTKGDIYKQKFYILLSKVFNCNPNWEDIKFIEKDNKLCLEILGDIIDYKEFDEIRKIILYSNLIDYDEKDEEVSEEIKKIYSDYVRLSNKKNNPPPLDKKILYVSKSCGCTKLDILNMTCRDFDIMFNMILEENEYHLCRAAELSGNVKFNNPIEHFMYKKSKNKYDEMFVSMDTFKETFGEHINN